MTDPVDPMYSENDSESQTEELGRSLELLRAHARELFDSREQAQQFEELAAVAARHVGSQDSLKIPSELSGLADLIHLVTTWEDHLQDLRSAGDRVLDWVAKGGRSLGLD